MSRYLPQMRVSQEYIAQAVRRAHGLKVGTYVRVLIGKQIGTILKSRAIKEQLTIISEDEFQKRAAGKFEEPVTTTGTSEVAP